MSICLQYQTVYCAKENSWRSAYYGIAAAAFLVLVLAFKIWLKTESVDLGYTLADFQKRFEFLDQERQKLELIVAHLSSPEVIRTQSIELGMQNWQTGQAQRIN